MDKHGSEPDPPPTAPTPPDRLLAPDPSLARYIEGYWRRSADYQPPRQVRVMADACTKLIFELAPMPWDDCYLIATQLAPIVVTLSGRVDRLGIRFRPGMAGFLLGLDLDGLPGHLIPGSALPMPGLATFHQALAEAGDDAKQTGLLDGWLRERLAASPPDEGQVTEVEAIRAMLGRGEFAPDVAAALDRSPRSLQRLCCRRFGASAARLHRLYRFERLLALLSGPPLDLADAADALGFSDQAHLAREFRAFAGIAVSGLLGERMRVGNLQDPGGWLPVLRRLEEDNAR